MRPCYFHLHESFEERKEHQAFFCVCTIVYNLYYRLSFGNHKKQRYIISHTSPSSLHSKMIAVFLLWRLLGLFIECTLKITLKTDLTCKTGLHDAQQVLKIFRNVAFMLQILGKPNTFSFETASCFSLLKKSKESV